MTSCVQRLRLVAGEDGGLHRSVPSPGPSHSLLTVRATARGCGCAVRRVTRDAAGEGGWRGGRAACPSPRGWQTCAPTARGALREPRLSRPPPPPPPLPRRGGMCRGGPAWRVSLHVREASWMALGVSAEIPPDTCGRTGLTGRTAAVSNEGAMITLSQQNVCSVFYLSEKLQYPAQDERQLQSSCCLA